MANSTNRKFRRGRAAALIAAVVLLVVAPGCNSFRTFRDRANTSVAKLIGTNYDDPEAEAKLQQAEELYQAGQYEKAQEIFRSLADNKGNPAALAERARFMQAECRYARGHYPEAADTYHKLLLDFPTGAYRRDCCARMYEICDYWLDDYRAELKQRLGENGILHWKPSWPEIGNRKKPWIDQEGRTLETLERIHMHDPLGPTADKALFWCGHVNFVRGNFSEADHYFSQLVELHPDSPLRPQAIALAIQAKNNATGGAVYDGRKCAEALQLIHMAEASVPELTKNEEMAAKLTRAKFAIRAQQAEKDFEMAEYYRRTGHGGSAVFYYELVKRRYAGTPYADMAQERQAYLLKRMEEGRPDPGIDPFAIAKDKIHEVLGRSRPVEEKDRPRADPNVVPAGGSAPPIGGAYDLRP